MSANSLTLVHLEETNTRPKPREQTLVFFTILCDNRACREKRELRMLMIVGRTSRGTFQGESSKVVSGMSMLCRTPVSAHLKAREELCVIVLCLWK